jgi:hypothetical protein
VKSKISAKVKAAALADLHAGEQPAVVAERYGIEMGTVRVWKARYVTDSVTQRSASPAPQRPSVAAQQRQIGEIVLDLLAAKLEASAALARAVSDPEWLARQSGSELAAIGGYLDSTALAIGDRLAGRGGAGGALSGDAADDVG